MGKGKQVVIEQWMTNAGHDIQMIHAALDMASPLCEIALSEAQDAVKNVEKCMAFVKEKNSMVNHRR